MPAQLIDGKAVAAQTLADVQAQIATRRAAGLRAPCLATLLVGDDPASHVYVRNKRDACGKVGITSRHEPLPADLSHAALLDMIDALNADDEVDGILVQFPLPSHFNTTEVIERILPTKDVDGFHPYNLGRLAQRQPVLRPCTPYGVMALLAHTGVNIKGMRALVIGASNHVGRPMALELLLAGVTTTTAHRFTRNLDQEVANAEILVAAGSGAGRMGAARRHRDRRGHQPPCRWPTGGRHHRRSRARARRVDHPGAGRRRPDDGGDADAQHADRAAGSRAGRRLRRQASRCRCGYSITASASRTRCGGNSQLKQLPSPNWLVIFSWASWRSTACLTIDNPRPVPPLARERPTSMR